LFLFRVSSLVPKLPGHNEFIAQFLNQALSLVCVSSNNMYRVASVLVATTDTKT
jgi:hypothetical protein